MDTFKRYSKSELWLLFSVVAFPIHSWALILIFRDLSWVMARTNAWDAIGVASYGLVIALGESIIIYLAILLLGFMVPGKLKENRRVSLLGYLILIVSFWAILSQLYFLTGYSPPEKVLQFLIGNAHPLRIMYAFSIIVVALTVLIPIFFILRLEKFSNSIYSFMDRLTTLVFLFLTVDIVGVIIVIFRNIF